MAIKMQQIIWTALPNGVGGDKLKLSVFASPRLWAAWAKPGLNQFPDWVDWPGVVAKLSFEIETDTGFVAKAQPTNPDLDSALWAELFPPSTFVRPHQMPDFAQRAIRTFPVRGTVGYLKDLYRKIGEGTPTELPKLQGPAGGPNLSQFLDDLHDVQDPALDRKMDAWLRERKVLEPGKLILASQVKQDFQQAYRFYDRREITHPDPLPALVIPEFDFHQMLTLLGDHPILMRRLGVVIDLEFERPPAAFGGVRVRPLWEAYAPAAYHEDRSPWTKVEITRSRFLAQPKAGSELADGMLSLRDVSFIPESKHPVFDLVQMDPDGAVLKAIHMAAGMYRLVWMEELENKRPAYDTPDHAGLPSTRSAGLALVRSARAHRMHQLFVHSLAQNATLQANNAVCLYADDLLRGYRVDILRSSEGVWRPLCQRIGWHLFLDSGTEIRLPDGTTPGQEVLDEGYVKAASTTSEDDGNSDLYLHETVFSWSGWSLVARRPGQTIVGEAHTAPDGTPRWEKVEPTANTAETVFRMQTEFQAAPGTLPRLRFGQSYRVRARVVDLAGNSLPASAKDDRHASEEVTYGRHEPIDPPVVTPRAVFAEGESLEKLVIRSNYDQGVQDYIDSTPVQDALSGKPHTYAVDSQRHIVPPKVAQDMAVTHGMLDEYIGPGADHQAGYNISLKEAGTLRDTQIVDTVTGNKVSIPDPSKVLAHPPTPAGGDPPDGQYIIHAEEDVLLPYLPDPIARGAALHRLPGLSAAGTDGLDKVIDPALGLRALKIPFELSWPDARSFRIRLAERPQKITGNECSAWNEGYANHEDPPHWDPDRRVLTVFLGKAQVAKIRYSSYPGKGGEGNSDLELLAVWHWLKGSACADELAKIAEAGAHWMLTPYRDMVLVHAVQQPLCEPTFTALSAVKDKIGQTHAVLVGQLRLDVKSTDKLDVQADWTEWVDNVADPEPVQVEHKAHVVELRVEETAKDALAVPKNDNRKHEFGDTRHRAVDYHLVGATRFREYFPVEITREEANITRTGPRFQVLVPNSARPAAPKPLYILPTFAWQEKREGPDAGAWRKLTRARMGSGLRVYMERPWYSSGDGELLGAVLWTGAANQWHEYQEHVSIMGLDPIHRSALPDAVLTAAHFANEVATATGLSLVELPGMQFGVAGFAPEYNSERKLWFCDIEFARNTFTSYFPFVRLALARYQPASIPNAHLSPVVLTDFAQAAPDRRLRIEFKGDTLVDLQVTGYAHDDYGPNRMEVALEEHDLATPGDLGWKAVAGKQENLRSNATATPYLWRWEGDLALPGPRGSKPYRLVVREYERYRADAPDRWTERVVYVDTVEL